MSTPSSNVYINRAMQDRMPKISARHNLAKPLQKILTKGLVDIDGCLVFKALKARLKNYYPAREDAYDRTAAEWFVNKLHFDDEHEEQTLDYVFGFLEQFKALYPADPKRPKYLLITDSINHPDITGPDGDFYPCTCFYFHTLHEGEATMVDEKSIETPYNARYLEIW